MMRDSGSTMTESAPAPFKLEREVTLMPSEFRERMSAKQRSQRSSAGTAKTRRSNGNIINSATSVLHHSSDSSNIKTNTRLESSPDIDHECYVTSVQIKNKTHGGHMDQQLGHYINETGELQSTTSHIELNGEFKFIMDNAYANSESEGGFNVQTPPSNLQIKDIMIPLEEWNSGGGGDTIQEKKYTVLPSIRNKKSVKSEDADSVYQMSSNSSEYSINNQLDFYRDRIEEDADFFADFRVNTSTVKATPRQDPLPPIKHGTEEYNTKPHRRRKKSQKEYTEKSNKNIHHL